MHGNPEVYAKSMGVIRGWIVYRLVLNEKLKKLSEWNQIRKILLVYIEAISGYSKSKINKRTRIVRWRLSSDGC